MMRTEAPIPIVEANDEKGVSVSDLMHLRRAVLWVAVLISPIAAAFVHEFGAFFVIFNSARLLRFEGKAAAAAAQAEPTAIPA